MYEIWDPFIRLKTSVVLKRRLFFYYITYKDDVIICLYYQNETYNRLYDSVTYQGKLYGNDLLEELQSFVRNDYINGNNASRQLLYDHLMAFT